MLWNKRFFLRVTALAWAPDGATLAVGQAQGITLHDAAIGKQLAGLGRGTDKAKGATGESRSLAWSTDGATLAEGGQDRMLRLWDVSTQRVRLNRAAHVGGPVIAVRWSPTDSALLLSANAASVHLWDTTADTTRWQTDDASGYPVPVAWSPDGQSFAFADHQYHIQIRNVPGELLLTYRGHAIGYCAPAVNPVAAIAWSPDGARIGSQGLDGAIHVWNPTSDAPGLAFASGDGWGHLLEWAPNCLWLAGRETCTSISLWDADTGQRVRSYPQSAGEREASKPIAIAWSPDSRRLAIAYTDHVVQVW